MGNLFSRDEIEKLIWSPVPEVQKIVNEKIKELERKENDPHLIVFKELIEISKEYPAVFAKAILKHPLFDYQIEFMNSIPHNKRIIVNAGRQVGKSTVVAISILWLLVVHPQQVKVIEGQEVKEPALYISVAPSYQQAQIIFNKVVNIIYQNQIFKELFIKQIKRSSSREEIITTLGSRYISRSVSGKSGPDILRGFTAKGVVIDEAAYVPKLDVVLNEIIEPMTATTDGWIILISSPKSREDYFWKIFKGEVKGWKAFHWTTDMNPLAKGLFELKKRELGENNPAFLKEYLALPEDMGISVFDLKKVHKLTRQRKYNIEEYDAIVAGLDIGTFEGPSNSALAVLGYKEDERLVEVIELVWMPSMMFRIKDVLKTTIDTLKKYEKYEKWLGGYYDKGGPGESIEDLFHALVFYLTPFRITQNNRLELIATLVSLVDFERITIPPEAEVLKKEMIEMTWVKRGNSYRPDHPPHGHDDAIMATALALRRLIDLKFKLVDDETLVESVNVLRHKSEEAKKIKGGRGS